MHKTALQNIYAHRYLLKKLTITSLTVQFKKSFLGATWLFLQPIITILAWVLLQGTGLFDPGDTGIPYPAYVLLSTSIWTLFVNLYTMVSNTLVGNGQLIMQHNFPREILILEKSAVAIFNFFIPFLLAVIVLLAYGITFSWKALLFPFALIPLALFGIAIGTLFALIKAVANDLNNFFDKAIVLVMYITPVVYANEPGSPLLSTILQWNPLTYLLALPRSLLLEEPFYEPLIFGVISLGVIIFAALMWRYFRFAQPKVIERLIA